MLLTYLNEPCWGKKKILKNTQGFELNRLNSAYAPESILNQYLRKQSVLKTSPLHSHCILRTFIVDMFNFLSSPTVSPLILLSRTMAVFMHLDRSFFMPALLMGKINARSWKCHNLTPTIALIVNYACLMAIYWGNLAHGWGCKTLCLNWCYLKGCN